MTGQVFFLPSHNFKEVLQHTKKVPLESNRRTMAAAAATAGIFRLIGMNRLNQQDGQAGPNIKWRPGQLICLALLGCPSSFD